MFGYLFSNCILETMFIKYLTHSLSAKDMNKSNVSICDVFSHRRNCSKYVMILAIEICARFLSKAGLPSIKSISVTSGIFVITNTSVFMDYITQSVMAFGPGLGHFKNRFATTHVLQDIYSLCLKLLILLADTMDSGRSFPWTVTLGFNYLFSFINSLT